MLRGCTLSAHPRVICLSPQMQHAHRSLTRQEVQNRYIYRPVQLNAGNHDTSFHIGSSTQNTPHRKIKQTIDDCFSIKHSDPDINVYRPMMCTNEGGISVQNSSSSHIIQLWIQASCDWDYRHSGLAMTISIFPFAGSHGMCH